MTPVRRATTATILFAALGAWALLFHDTRWDVTLPNAIFYAIITINTFFSVRFFSSFTPLSPAQTVVDALLVVAYAALALSIGLPAAFGFFALLIFVIAPMKYAHMLGKTGHDKTLRRKILIDLSGTLLTASALAGTLLGFEVESAWALAIIFAIANIYWLLISPMYRFVD